jgi:hypothetical protein
VRIWVCGESWREWSPATVIRESALQGIPIDAVHMHLSGRSVLVHARDNIVRMLDLRTNTFMQRWVRYLLVCLRLVQRRQFNTINGFDTHSY